MFLKMSSRVDKENDAQKARGARSKIPILANRLRSGKIMSLLGERRPLQNIQATTDGAMTHADFQAKIHKRPSVTKAETTRVAHLLPKGSVYKLIKNKTTLQNEAKHKPLQDRFKNVTVRNRHDSPLDGKLEVFQNCGTKEQFGNNSNQATLIAKKVKRERRSKSAECPTRTPKPLPPTLITIAQHNLVKNIKRSLKSPRSREIQNRASSKTGIQLEAAPLLKREIQNRDPSETNMQLEAAPLLQREIQSRASIEADMQLEPALVQNQASGETNMQLEATPLLQREIQSRASIETDMQLGTPTLLQRDRARKVLEFDLDQEVWKHTQELTQCYERGILHYLLLIGQKLQTPPRICPRQRSIVVNWLVRINGIQTPHILQVAVHHLDRALAMGAVPIESVQLLAAACFWLAQKQCGTKPKPATYFERHAVHAFSAMDLISAERYILRRLNWPSIPVVADDFVPFLVQQCSPNRPEPLTSAATFLCTAALLDADLSACTPDLLALAAVINCVMHLQGTGNIDSLFSSPLFQSACCSRRLYDVRLQLLRAVLVMREDSCPCREPYVQHSRAPHHVAPRLAARVANFFKTI